MTLCSTLRILLAATLAVVWAGCQSSPTGAGTGKYAAVEIDGFSRSAVEMATEQVFKKEGYQLSAVRADSMIFERQASKSQNLVWGNWTSSLWDRVVVKLTRLTSEDNFLLSADAYRVQNKDDSTMEKETKMGFAVQSEYQKLLEKVKVLLAPMPTASGVGTAPQ